MSSRGKQKKEEEQARQSYQQEIQAYKPSPLEEAETARIMKFRKQWDGGTDVKDIEGLAPYLDLFNASKQGQESARVGTGMFALGGQNTSGNVSQASDLEKLIQSQKEQAGQGMLYNAANQANMEATGQGNFLINTDQQRKAGRSGLAGQFYQTTLQRPRDTPWWKTALGLAMGGAQAAGGLGWSPFGK